LDEDKYLLDIDFDELGDAPASTRQAWLSEMEAARLASEQQEQIGSDSWTDMHLDPVDTEGSIRFRRRRKRYLN
jgi:hypothetical protein